MMKKIIVFLLLLLGVAPGPASAESYKVSILPRFFPEKLTAMMTPLVKYLHEETGYDIDLVLTKDFKDYESRLAKGEVAIGFQNPVVYTRITPQHQVVAMAQENGEDRFRGLVIVRPDGPVRRLKDLKGKRVMIVSETSAGGFLSQKLTLMENEIAVSDLNLEVAADNRQENVIIAVSVGDMDAGFIREAALHVADKYIAPGSIRDIEKTAWLPGWALSLDRGVPEAARSKITAALLKLQPGSPEMKALEMDRFVPAKDADYDATRKASGGR